VSGSSSSSGRLPQRSAAAEQTPQQVFIDQWSAEAQGPELRDYWVILKKRRWVAAGFFLVVMGAALGLSLISTPIYSASTVLLIEPNDPEVIDINLVVGGSAAWGEDYYNTQHEMLRSRSLAARVVHDLQLDQEASFVNGDTGPLAWVSGLAYTGLYWVGSWFFEAEDFTDQDFETWLVDLYLEGLWVEPVPRSRMVRLYFDSSDPELASRVVNAHAAAYIDQGLEFRRRASREARGFLEGKLVELRARVEESEAALNAYRHEHGIVSLDDKSNVVIERLADINMRLTEAEAERIAREADAALIRNRQAESLPAVIESLLVRTIKEQLVELEGEHAAMSRKFKPGYPRRAELEAQIRNTRRRLAREIQSIVAGIESAYLAAQANERELRSRMEAQKEEALRLKDASVEYAILGHDAETSRQLYDSVRQRIKETGMAAELRASNVFVVDAAHPPFDPTWPRTGRNLAMGLLCGLLGGVGLAFLSEYLDHRLRGPDEVERLLGLRSLGVVPESPKLDSGSPRRPSVVRGRGGELVRLPATGPRGIDDVPPSITESYSSIRTSILLSQPGRQPKTILFSSSAEGEGKTTTLLHTATMFARLGAPTLVVDADLRRPTSHRLLGVENRQGLTEVLRGQEARIRGVQIEGAPLYFLASGGTPSDPTGLLGSGRMKEVLARLAERFDHILIDAPPLMPLSDAVLLSTLVDGVVLVIDQQRAPRQSVRQAWMRLAYARANVLGFVLNRAEPSASEYAEFRREAA
jgi:capsular exopolysaccharide synthesis family protein